MKISIFWYRRDLRLEDNTGLFEALNENENVLPIFIFDDSILDELPEDQVEAPDVETVLSDPIVVTGIDIPVTIKSNFPIQVRFDDDDPDLESNWKDVQQI